MMSPACMFSVAMIHLFRVPPATKAMSADLQTKSKRDCADLNLWPLDPSVAWGGSDIEEALVSPARVVSDLNNFLLKRQRLFVRLIAQSLEVDPPVFLFMTSANAVCPYPSCVRDWEMSDVRHWLSAMFHSGSDPLTALLTWMISASRLFHPHGTDWVLLPLLPQCAVLLQRRRSEESPALSHCTEDAYRWQTHLRSQFSLCNCLSTHTKKQDTWVTSYKLQVMILVTSVLSPAMPTQNVTKLNLKKHI